MKKGLLFTVISCFFVVIGIGLVLLYFYIRPLYTIDKKDIIVEAISDGKYNITILTNDKNIKCKSNSNWSSSLDNRCVVSFDQDNVSKVYLKKGYFSTSFDFSEYSVKIDIPSKIYMPLNDKKKISSLVKGNNSNINFKSSNPSVFDIEGDYIVSKEKGYSYLDIYVKDSKIKSLEVEVTNLITKRPKKFDKSKKYLACHKYNKTEAKKIDEILKNRIENVGGYKTRAAVVEAIRFLMLDFKYRLPYFYENGRLINGIHYVDGEGRYYHKGLYLSDDKFKDIKSTYVGPAIWGCPLMNFQDDPPEYIAKRYYPNGLDCSGFVSWAIYNGGYDVGDRGAGDSLKDDTELNDVGGEKKKITDKLVNSGVIKAGDIVGIWGHIAIVAGIDSKNVYVAESLWTYGGVVINKYPKNKLDDQFVQVVLMDDVYKKDGLYTDMW